MTVLVEDVVLLIAEILADMVSIVDSLGEIWIDVVLIEVEILVEDVVFKLVEKVAGDVVLCLGKTVEKFAAFGLIGVAVVEVILALVELLEGEAVLVNVDIIFAGVVEKMVFRLTLEEVLAEEDIVFGEVVGGDVDFVVIGVVVVLLVMTIAADVVEVVLFMLTMAVKLVERELCLVLVEVGIGILFVVLMNAVVVGMVAVVAVTINQLVLLFCSENEINLHVTVEDCV